MKALLGIGVVLSGAIGALWAGLYWRGDPGYGAAIVAVNVAAGASAALAVCAIPRLRSAVGPAGLSCGIIALLWWVPIALFHVDRYYVDIRLEPLGLMISALGLAGAFALALLLGTALQRLGAPARAICVLAFFAAPPAVALAFGPAAVPTYEIVDRLDAGKRPEAATGSRVMVLGLDGGTWDAIVPLLERGRLPHLRSLMERGQFGVLNSVTTSQGDTASPAVWTSIFTGMRPEKHGIDNWFVSDSRNRTVKSLWNILNERGDLAVTVNIPATFPPEVVLGAQVSGFPIPGMVTSTSRRFHISDGRIYSTRNLALEALPLTRLSMTRDDAAAVSALSYSPVYRTELPVTGRIEMKHGALQHAAYRLHVGNLWIELMERRGVLQTRALRTLDLVALDTTDDGAVDYDTVHVYADGSEPLAVLGAGQWSDWIEVPVGGTRLEFKLRLLDVADGEIELYATPLFQSSFDPQVPFTYPPDLAATLSRAIGQYVVEGAGWTMFADTLSLDALYEHVLDVGAQHLRASQMLLGTVPDWRLFVHIFTELDRVSHAFWRFHEPGPYPAQDPRLVARHGGKLDALLEIIDAQVGEILARLDESTTVVVVSDHGFGPDPDSGTGQHRIEGIYILAGPDVKASGPLRDLDVGAFPRASVVDVTPTILYLLGYPVARDMDGRVLSEVVGDAHLACCPVESIETYETSREVRQARQFIDKATEAQLKSLGYVE